MYTFGGAALGGPALACIREGLEQDLEAFGRVRMAKSRVQLRERRMSQDVDRRRLLRGQRGDPVGLGIHAQLPYEGGRLHPFRGLVNEGR